MPLATTPHSICHQICNVLWRWSTCNISSELDLPITHRKGTQSYSKLYLPNYILYDNISPLFWHFSLVVDSQHVPKNNDKSLLVHVERSVMDEEKFALLSHKTWELVEVLPGVIIVGCSNYILLNIFKMEQWTCIKLILLPNFRPLFWITSRLFLVVRLYLVHILIFSLVNSRWHVHLQDIKNILLRVIY